MLQILRRLAWCAFVAPLPHSAAQISSPDFEVTWTGACGLPSVKHYTPTLQFGSAWYFNYAELSASVSYSASTHEYTLSLTNNSGTCTASQVRFPIDENIILGASSANDITYLPILTGVALGHDSSYLTAGTWQPDVGWVYPGMYFSPFSIIADTINARIIYASNFSPQRVIPQVKAGGQSLLYDTASIPPSPPPSNTGVFRHVSRLATGSATNPPWMNAAEYYQSWIREKMDLIGMYPVEYADWIQKIHGYMAVHLQDYVGYYNDPQPPTPVLCPETITSGPCAPQDDGICALAGGWEDHKAVFPWIQIWGQMSSYVCNNANPPTCCDQSDCLVLSPACGCCGLDRNLNARYVQPAFDIKSFANTVKSYTSPSGISGHIGYYTRPYEGYNLDDYTPYPQLGNQTPLQWFDEWVTTSKDSVNGWRANAVYFDTLGAGYFGDGFEIASNLFYTWNDPNQIDTLIEWPVDIYPSAYLSSGGMNYRGIGFCGGPGYTMAALENQNGLVQQIPFPELGTFVLSDRIFFSGASNGNSEVWGRCLKNLESTPNPPYGDIPPCLLNLFYNPGAACCDLAVGCDDCAAGEGVFWAERQAFLLGHKYDFSGALYSSCDDHVDEAVLAAVAARDSVSWWDRTLRYWGRRGITSQTGDIDVRRFQDLDEGCDFFTVDNWSQTGGSFVFGNRTYVVAGGPTSARLLIKRAICIQSQP